MGYEMIGLSAYFANLTIWHVASLLLVTYVGALIGALIALHQHDRRAGSPYWSLRRFFFYFCVAQLIVWSLLVGSGKSLNRLRKLADFLPLPTRKAINALVGDYDVEIRRLRKAHRPKAASWNSMLAWGCALWIVLKFPLTKVLEYIVKLPRV